MAYTNYVPIPPKRWSFLKIFLVTCLILLLCVPVLAFIIFFAVYTQLFRPYQMSGESMYPTLPNHAFILTTIVHKGFLSLERGDIIVFHSPLDPQRDVVKRVIGLPSEHITLHKGSVLINGYRLIEPYVKTSANTHGETFVKDDTEVTIPADSYFVLGDNRQYSSDSREWGFVTQEALIGKYVVCYYNCH